MFDRQNGTGHVRAVEAQYEDAQEKGNPVFCALLEALCGTFSDGLLDFMDACAEQHNDNQINPAYRGYSWTAPTFTAHHALQISTAFHKGMAKEMLLALDTTTERRPRTRFGRGQSHRHRDRRATFGDCPTEHASRRPRGVPRAYRGGRAHSRGAQ